MMALLLLLLVYFIKSSALKLTCSKLEVIAI